MSDYGIKIAKDESDIDSIVPGDYELWSKYPMLKIKKSGSGSVDIVVSSGVGSISIEIDDDPTTFEPIVFIQSDVYDPVAGSKVTDVSVPYRRQNSTAILSCDYYIERSSGKIYYKGSVTGGIDDTYSLAYEYIIFYDKFNV